MWESVHYRRNEIILREGMSTEKIYYIVKGNIELTSEYEATKQLAAGEIFGELSLIRNAPSTATALTKSDVHLKEIQKEEFLESIATEPEMAKVVMKSLFKRCESMNERLQELEANTTHNRIMQMTKKRSQQHGIILRGISSRANDALNDRELIMDQFPFHFCRKPSNPGPLAYMSNYLLLNDDAPFEISQNHCRLVCKGEKIILIDDTSRFGTLVNGTSIGRKFPRQAYELTEGTHQIHLGPSSHCQYAFEIEIHS